MNAIKTILAITVALLATATQAQVVNSINEQNMKIPHGERPPRPQREPAAVSNDVQIDTTTQYFRYVDAAQEHTRKGEYDKAEESLRNAIKSEPGNPNNSMLVSNIATLQRYQGKTAQAIKNYTLALDMTPNAVAILTNRATAYMAIDSMRLAAMDFKRVVALDAYNTEARYNLGIIAIQQHDFKQAEDYFMEMLKISPNSALAQEGLGKLNEVNGNYQKAIDCYSKIIKVRPTAAILANRAHCYLMTKRLNDAEDDIRGALIMAPTDGYLYLLRSILNKQRFSYDDANRDIKLALQHGITQQEVDDMLKTIP